MLAFARFTLANPVPGAMEGFLPFKRSGRTKVDPSQPVRDGLIALLPRLRRLARALAGQAADADDLVQIVLERALVRARQWRPDAPLDKWVFAIARNAWRDEMRSRGRAQNVFAFEEAGALVADGASAPAQKVELAAALAALPPDHREVVALVLVEGLSYTEAAELLEVPVGTVTSRLARARAALQTHLGSDA
jgi:RNA polymerase sigma-70 factor (ECF subfamily)